MIRDGFKVLFSLILLGPSIEICHAAELIPSYRSARVTGMGGAYLGLSDDESTVFLNPAGLGRNKKNSIHYLIMDIDANTEAIFNYGDLLGLFSDFSIRTINSLMGRDTLARIQASPVFIMDHLALGVLVDGQFGLMAKNKALPEVILGYQTTTAIQLSYGMSLTQRGRRPRNVLLEDLSIGASLRAAWRRGGYRPLTPIQLLNLQQSGGGTDILNSVAGNWGMGVGVDAGMYYTKAIHKTFRIGVGSSFLDIGDTAFTDGGDPQKGNWTIGVAGIYEDSGVSVKLAYDYSHILEPTDPLRKSHLGLELDFPGIDIFGGINQVYLTYGIAFNLGLVKLYLISYGTELDGVIRMNPDRRYLMRVDLSFGL